MGRVAHQEALIDPRKNRIVVLEDLNFVWDEKELIKISHMWREEKSVTEIGKYFDRDPDEVILALIHLAKCNNISPRKTGLR